MSGFGDKLRREREMRGVSLEEIAESTKIGTRSLRALEDEDFEKLPGGIFNRGFVRAYSRFLGLDEDQTVADFDVAWREHQAAKAPPPELLPEEKEEPKKSSPGPLLVSAVVLIAVAAAGWYVVKRQNAGNIPDAPAAQSTTEIQPKPQPASSQPDQAISTPAPPTTASQSGTAPSVAEATKPTKAEPPKESKSTAAAPEKPQTGDNVSEPPTEANAPIHLEVFAREDSWLSVSVDGKSLGQGILPAQKSRTIRAQREVHLRVGNVAGVEVSFNGRPISIDGEPKQVRDLIFTPDGLRQ